MFWNLLWVHVDYAEVLKLGIELWVICLRSLPYHMRIMGRISVSQMFHREMLPSLHFWGENPSSYK